MRIALVVNVLNEEYQISVYRGVNEAAKKYGIDIVCLQMENQEFSQADFLPMLAKREYFNLDGIILLTSVLVDNYDIKTRSDVEKMFGTIPVISVGQKVQGLTSLLIETEASMKALVEHLILQHKYMNFLFIGGSSKQNDAIIREEIFRRTIEAYKPWFPELTYSVQSGYFTEVDGIEVMKKYFSRENAKSPDAVVCANDNMAIGVYKYFSMSKKWKGRVPAVTGFDDVPQAKYCNPSLTTVHQPLKEMGAEAVKIIRDLILGNPVNEDYYIESDVVFRNSCGCKFEYAKDKAFFEDFSQLQSNYLYTENLLQQVTHAVQDINYVQSTDGLKFVLEKCFDQFGLDNFCILRFSEPGKKTSSVNNAVLTDPLYVRVNGEECFDFLRELKIPLGQFFRRFQALVKGEKSLAIKTFQAEEDFSGCFMYSGDESLLPYISTITVNIVFCLNKLSNNEKRNQRSEYLEREVALRTKELVEANNRRMEVEAEVLKISELERQRFSNDLHDDICQQLAGISMLCRSYSNQDEPVKKEQMAELAELIGSTLLSTRQYAHNSYPVELESLGMKRSLSNLCSSFEKQSSIKCNYIWSVPHGLELSKVQKLNIFRIIQEALHNVVKHARAKNVSVSVNYAGEFLTVSICDDGCGFNKKDNAKKGLGLNSMQFRANQIGATFAVKSNEPSGTCVILSVKLE